MSSESQAYAAKVLAAFTEAGLYTDDEVKAAGGPSSTTMGKLRKAASGGSLTEPRGDVHRRIDVAAKWARGSSRQLWHHQQEPVTAADPGILDPAEAVRQSNMHPVAKAAILRMLEKEEPPTPEPPTQQDVG